MTDRHSPRSDEDFAKAAADLLRRSAEDIDAHTALRLNRARQAALEQFPSRPRAASWLVPAVSTAVLGALVVGLWFREENGPDVPAQARPAVESAADMDLLLADDSLEMLKDLEFYAWLDADLSDAELRAELESAS